MKMHKLPILALLLSSTLLVAAARAEEKSPAPASQPGGALVGGRLGVGAGWSAYGPFGNPGMNFEQFWMTLTQLNMTPEFNLDKEAKRKLNDVHEEWKQAQAKFMKENQPAFQKLNQEQAEAFKARDQEKIKELVKQSQELYASAPKSEEYITKAKAALPADELKAVEEHLKTAEEQRKAMMEKYRAQEGREGQPNPAPPINERK